MGYSRTLRLACWFLTLHNGSYATRESGKLTGTDGYQALKDRERCRCCVWSDWSSTVWDMSPSASERVAAVRPACQEVPKRNQSNEVHISVWGTLQNRKLDRTAYEIFNAWVFFPDTFSQFFCTTRLLLWPISPLRDERRSGFFPLCVALPVTSRSVGCQSDFLGAVAIAGVK